MAEYLNYGNLQVDLQALLNSLANNVQSYVLKLPWSNKRKEKFMSAYQDIMSRGLKGASNNTGKWVIEAGGEQKDFNSLSKKDREMYGEAAYFIQQQMNLLAISQENELKKAEIDRSNLPIFDNNEFINSFITHISKQDYGGRPFIISDNEDTDMWNKLDQRDSKGIRGTEKRRAKLAEYLTSYKNKFDDTKYNFEGSPFENADDFKRRLDNAITALGTQDINDDDIRLNQIGINPKDWFNNGSGDFSGKYDLQGNKLSYGLYYNEFLPKLNEQQIKVLLEQAAARLLKINLNRYTSLKFYTGAGKSLSDLSKYGNNVLNQLNSYWNKPDLTDDEKAELVGAFRNAKPEHLTNVSDEELLLLGSRYSGLKGRFKKLKGLEGFYWDSVGQRVVHGVRGNGLSFIDLVLSNNPDLKLQEYLNLNDFTEADEYELAGIVADIASIIDPEPWSAGILGVGAAGARNYARTRGPGEWKFGDYFWQGVDYISGALGFIPVAGDSLLAYKLVKNAGKFLQTAMRIPAFYDMISSSSGAYSAANKILNGENPTIKEWQELGTFFRGLATNRQLNLLNRASRKALLERGYEVSDKWHEKLGLTLSKPVGEVKTTTIKVKTNGEIKEIPISSETKQALDMELLNKGNDVEVRSKVVKENPKVLEAAREAGIDLNNATIVYSKSLMNARLFKNKFGLTPKWMRTSGKMYGESTLPVLQGEDTFKSYLEGDRGLLDKWWYGSNRTLRGADKYNKSNFGITSSSETPTPVESRTPAPVESGTLTRDEIQKLWKDVHKGNHSGNALSEEPFEINGFNFELNKFPNSESGILDVTFNGNKNSISFNNQKDLMKKVEQYLKNNRIKVTTDGKTKSDITKMGEVLRKLKEKGVFKQGGRIDKLKIQKYKEFIRK